MLKYLILTIFSFAFFLHPSFAQVERQLEPIFIAKSTFIYVADSKSKDLQPKGICSYLLDHLS